MWALDICLCPQRRRGEAGHQLELHSWKLQMPRSHASLWTAQVVLMPNQPNPPPRRVPKVGTLWLPPIWEPSGKAHPPQSFLIKWIQHTTSLVDRKTMWISCLTAQIRLPPPSNLCVQPRHCSHPPRFIRGDPGWVTCAVQCGEPGEPGQHTVCDAESSSSHLLHAGPWATHLSARNRQGECEEVRTATRRRSLHRAGDTYMPGIRGWQGWGSPVHTCLVQPPASLQEPGSGPSGHETLHSRVFWMTHSRTIFIFPGLTTLCTAIHLVMFFVSIHILKLVSFLLITSMNSWV